MDKRITICRITETSSEGLWPTSWLIYYRSAVLEQGWVYDSWEQCMMHADVLIRVWNRI